jgi:hypothetical protein
MFMRRIIGISDLGGRWIVTSAHAPETGTKRNAGILRSAQNYDSKPMGPVWAHRFIVTLGVTFSRSGRGSR